MYEAIFNIVLSAIMLGVFYEVYSFIAFNRTMLMYGITFDRFSIEGVDFDTVSRIRPKSFMKGSVNDTDKEVYFRRKYLSVPAILLNYWYSPYVAIMKYSVKERRFDVQLKAARASAYMTIVILTVCVVGILVMRLEQSGVLAVYFVTGCLYWFLHYLSFRNIRDEVVSLLKSESGDGA